MNENNENKKQDGGYSSLTGFHRAMPIILAALAVFVAVCYITDGTGVLGDGVGAVLIGLFSAGAYAIPALLVIHAIFYAEDLAEGKILSRTIFSVITLLAVSVVEYAIVFWGKDYVFAPVEFFTEGTAGGFIGSILAFGLINVLGPVGIIILAVALLLVYISFFFSRRDGAVKRAFIAALSAIVNALSAVEGFFKKLFSKKAKQRKTRKEREADKRSAELLDDQFFEVDNGMRELRISELGIHESKSGEAIEKNPTLQESVRHKSAYDGEPTVISFSERAAEKKTPDLSYGESIRKSEPSFEKKASAAPTYEKPTESFGDESADAIFTRDFDPYDFMNAEKIASRPSSKAQPRVLSTGISVNERPLSSVSPEELEKERRREEFERKKQQIIAERRRREEALRVHVSESAGVTVEAERTAEPKSVEPSRIENVTATAPAVEKPESAVRVTEVFGGGESLHTLGKERVSQNSEERAYGTPPNTSEATVHELMPKSVAFRVENKPESAVPEPTEYGKMSFTFDKGEHSDTDSASEKIAEMVALSNPAYRRNFNATSVRMEIRESAASNEADSTASEEGAPNIGGSAANEISDAQNLNASVPYGAKNEAYSAAGVRFEDASADYEKEPAFAAAGIYEDTPAEPEAPVIKRFEAQSEPEAPAFKQIEEQSEPKEPVFKQFEAPIERIVEPTVTESVRTDADVLKTERTLLSPTPAPAAKEAASPERDSRFTVIDEDMPLIDPKAQDGGISVSNCDEGTFLDFGDGEDGESEDGSDGAMSFPEGEEIITEEIPPEEQNPDVIKMREMFPFLNDESEPEDDSDEEYEELSLGDDEESSLDAVEPFSGGAELQTEESLGDEDSAEDDAPPFDMPTAMPQRTAPEVPAALGGLVAPVKEEPKKEKKPDYSKYVFPPIDLLGLDAERDDEGIQEEIQDNADKLIDTLASFNVTASIKGVDRGPRITRYEVVPARGVKTSSVMNLQDDIALNLAAGDIRMEAPIPGKSAIGIEIPNKKPSTVRLRELIEAEEFVSAKSKTSVCIGKDVAGQPVFSDIANMPHLLVAGATGMGKSVCINSLMISILYKARPDEVKFIMIDPKQVEFTMYNGIPHLLVPVVSDAKQAAGSLMWAVEEMERRYNLINSLCVRNIDAYNDKVTKDKSLGEPMSRIIIVIDEFADLMAQVKDPVENLVMRIAAKARAAGIHLIVGTQRPSVDVITGVIKANIPTRFSCKVASNRDSGTVLDSAGAEKLLNKGDMLLKFTNSTKPIRVQGAFVADSEVENIMAHIKSQGGASYDSNVMEEIERQAQKCSKKGGSSDDDYDDDGDSGEGYLNDRQFLDAVEVAVNARKISTSLIQRKLSIGYGKAAKFIDIMEGMGIVSEPNGQKPRDVLITADEWYEKLSRISLD